MNSCYILETHPRQVSKYSNFPIDIKGVLRRWWDVLDFVNSTISWVCHGNHLHDPAKYINGLQVGLATAADCKSAAAPSNHYIFCRNMAQTLRERIGNPVTRIAAPLIEHFTHRPGHAWAVTRRAV